MIEKLKPMLKNAKFMVFTMTDLGEKVRISVTIRPKDGSDNSTPLQVESDYLIADTVLLTALDSPPKAGKEKKIELAKENEENSLF